jgi:hypothetical protein
MLHWTNTFGKLCVLWVQRFKYFYSLFQNTDSNPNVFCKFLCVVDRLAMWSLDHTNTHTKTHTYTHTNRTHIRNNLPQRPITTQNTTNPRYEHPCPERDSNLRYLQSTGRRPHGHRERRLSIHFTLNSFFLKKLNSYSAMYSFKLAANIFLCKLSAFL